MKLEDLAFRQQHLSNPICSHPAYAAVVAASCGSSLRTLDRESLVVHLARMGRDTARPGFVGGAGGGERPGKGEQEASSDSMVDSIIANMLEGAGAADAAEAEGGERYGRRCEIWEEVREGPTDLDHTTLCSTKLTKRTQATRKDGGSTKKFKLCYAMLN